MFDSCGSVADCWHMLVFNRQKVFQDIQRFLNTADIINEPVFDLEDSR